MGELMALHVPLANNAGSVQTPLGEPAALPQTPLSTVPPTITTMPTHVAHPFCKTYSRHWPTVATFAVQLS